MHDWRGAGFVADSDDDGELSDIEPTPRYQQDGEAGGTLPSDGGVQNAVHVLMPPRTSDLKLHSSQLQNREDKTRTSGSDSPNLPAAELQEKDVFDLSDTSSELSSPPSSIEELQRLFDLPTTQALPAQESESQPADVEISIFSPANDNLLSNTAQAFEESVAQPNAVRNFRKRNAIQLHPYALENEQYRQSLQARGLRPVVIGETTTSHHPSNAQHSQYTESQEDSYNDSGFREDFQNLFSSSEDEEPSQAGFQFASSQHIPRVNVVRSNGHISQHEETRGRAKRRKIDSSPRTVITATNPSAPNLSRKPELRANKASSSEDNNNDRISRREKRRIMRAKFQVPRGMTPPPLPTPDPSSELAVSEPQIIEADDAQGLRTLFSDDSASPEEISDAAETSRIQRSSVDQEKHSSRPVDDTSYLKNIRRRMKGVLPASWVHLDRQTQLKLATKPRDRNQVLNTPEDSVLKGVARRTGRALLQQTPNNARLSMYDDSESSPERSPLVNVSGNSTWRGPTNTIEINDDISEEDEIDDMAPKEPRSTTRRLTYKKQKRKLPATSVELERRPRRRRAELQQSRLSVRKDGHRQRRTVTSMSICDAAPSDSRESMPHFIRVARRTCSSRPNKGRHSPTNKVFSLYSRDEGVHMHNTLIDWRSGRLERQAQQSTSIQNQVEQSPHVHGQNFNIEYNRITTPLRSVHQRQQDTLDGPLPVGTKSNLDKNSLLHKSRSSSDVTFSTRYRPGQLEATEGASPLGATSGSRRLRSILDQVDAGVASSTRFDNFHSVGQDVGAQNLGDRQHRHTPRSLKQPPPRRKKNRRKNPPRPHVVESTEVYELPRLEADEASDEPNYASHAVQDSTLKLKGIGAYGTDYSTNFGIKPLQSGTCLHTNTFVGSGELATSLSIRNRDLGNETVTRTLQCGTLATKLGVWDDELADRLDFVGSLLVDSTTSHMNSYRQHNGPNEISVDEISKVLRQIMLYIAEVLWFKNPGDRHDCVQKMAGLAETLINAVTSLLEPMDDPLLGDDRLTAFSHSSPYLLVILTQLNMLCDDNFEDQALMNTLHILQTKFATTMMDNNVGKQIPLLDDFYSSSNLRLVLETGIKKEHPCSNEIETVICLYHCLDQSSINDSAFWTILQNTLRAYTLHNASDVHCLENAWKALYSILPFLAFDVHGLLQPSSTINSTGSSSRCWDIVKELCASVLGQCTRNDSPAILNNYVKAILRRCYTLIATWRWHTCEPILSYLFDFFASRELAQLSHESGKGPSKFLENFSPARDAHLEQADSSFQLFLKCLAVGISRLRNVKPEKKIKNIVWRFVPNHGRQHRKEDQLSQRDLDALRNHHELLCVLHMASPCTARPRVSIIRHLVDFSASHVEASRVSIRAWCNLTRFQLGTAEPLDNLLPFSDWLNVIIRDCLSLYSTAQTEAETFGRLNGNTSHMSKQWLDQVVRANQRQVLVLLETAMDCLAEALAQAVDLNVMQEFFQCCNLSELYGLLDHGLKHSKPLALCVLAVYKQFLAQTQKLRNQKTHQASNDESQDYGDWPEDDVIDAANQTSLADETALVPLHQLLSNWFGDEKFQDDQLLADLVETWAAAAAIQVQQQIHDWSYFIEAHGPNSWHQLRETSSKRKFMPYFMAKVVSLAPDSLVSNEEAFFNAWLTSIVESDNLLQYQNRLTEILLEQCSSNPLLFNLPFATTSAKASISPTEFSTRRMLLIDCVLSNMQTHLAVFEPARQRYVEILKLLMAKMKATFLDLEQSSSQHNAYVGFVQTVVQLLQQYTAEIYPVDRFFIDNAAFPLPLSDPLYITGRLQSYAFRIQEHSNQKKLALFIQNVVERGIIEDKQQYLVDQFTQSLRVNTDRRNSTNLSEMRCILLGSIFPAYIAAVNEHTCGWLFARPILRICSSVIPALLVGVNLLDKTRLRKLERIMHAMLGAVTSALASIVKSDTPLNDQVSTSTLGYMLQVATSSLFIVDFVRRLAHKQSQVSLVRLLQSLSWYSRKIKDQQNLSSEPVSLNNASTVVRHPEQYSNGLSSYVFKSLLDSLRFWGKRNATTFFVRRGTVEKEAHVDVGTLESEKECLRVRVEEFQNAFLQTSLSEDIMNDEAPSTDPPIRPEELGALSNSQLGVFV